MCLYRTSNSNPGRNTQDTSYPERVFLNTSLCQPYIQTPYQCNAVQSNNQPNTSLTTSINTLIVGILNGLFPQIFFGPLFPPPIHDMTFSFPSLSIITPFLFSLTPSCLIAIHCVPGGRLAPVEV